MPAASAAVLLERLKHSIPLRHLDTLDWAAIETRASQRARQLLNEIRNNAEEAEHRATLITEHPNGREHLLDIWGRLFDVAGALHESLSLNVTASDVLLAATLFGLRLTKRLTNSTAWRENVCRTHGIGSTNAGQIHSESVSAFCGHRLTFCPGQFLRLFPMSNSAAEDTVRDTITNILVAFRGGRVGITGSLCLKIEAMLTDDETKRLLSKPHCGDMQCTEDGLGITYKGKHMFLWHGWVDANRFLSPCTAVHKLHQALSTLEFIHGTEMVSTVDIQLREAGMHFVIAFRFTRFCRDSCTGSCCNYCTEGPGQCSPQTRC